MAREAVVLATTGRGVTALGTPDDPRLEGWRTIPIPEMTGEVRLAVYHR